MEEVIRVVLPVYFIVYFGIAFVAKSIIVAKRTGRNPLVLRDDDSAYGLIGRYFKLTLIAMFGYVVAFGLYPQLHQKFLPFTFFANSTACYIGLALLAVSLLWTVVAQVHMSNSWRIGIDTEVKTALVTSGLFGVSRNPIFLGMIVSLIGLFLLTPNVVTVIFLIVGYMLIQIQIRLEEAFLATEHKVAYTDYKASVRRLI